MKRKIDKRKADEMTVEQMRVVKIPKRERKERVVESMKEILQSKAKKLSNSDKKIRALNKKLRQIEQLIERKDGGEEMNEDQLAKIDSLGECLDQMEALMAKAGVKEEDVVAASDKEQKKKSLKKANQHTKTTPLTKKKIAHVSHKKSKKKHK